METSKRDFVTNGARAKSQGRGDQVGHRGSPSSTPQRLQTSGASRGTSSQQKHSWEPEEARKIQADVTGCGTLPTFYYREC